MFADLDMKVQQVESQNVDADDVIDKFLEGAPDAPRVFRKCDLGSCTDTWCRPGHIADAFDDDKKLSVHVGDEPFLHYGNDLGKNFKYVMMSAKEFFTRIAPGQHDHSEIATQEVDTNESAKHFESKESTSWSSVVKNATDGKINKDLIKKESFQLDNCSDFGSESLIEGNVSASDEEHDQADKNKEDEENLKQDNLQAGDDGIKANDNEQSQQSFNTRKVHASHYKQKHFTAANNFDGAESDSSCCEGSELDHSDWESHDGDIYEEHDRLEIGESIQKSIQKTVLKHASSKSTRAFDSKTHSESFSTVFSEAEPKEENLRPTTQTIKSVKDKWAARAKSTQSLLPKEVVEDVEVSKPKVSEPEISDTAFLYLRSLHSKMKRAAELSDILPEKLYKEIKFPLKNVDDNIEVHSSVLRACSQGLSVWLHYDSFDNFLCCVSGKKRVWLFEPNEVGNLYITDSSSEIHNPMKFDAHTADERKEYENYLRSNFPRAVNAFKRRYEVVLSPGDVLFIPVNWAHCTRCEKAESASISTNFFFVNKHAVDVPRNGKDTWGNKYPMPVENAYKLLRSKIMPDLDKLPVKHRDFFLRKLAAELENSCGSDHPDFPTAPLP